MRRGLRLYILISAGLIVGFAGPATVAWLNRDWGDNGPLSKHAPNVGGTLPGATVSRDQALDAAFPGNIRDGKGYDYRVVGGTVRGRPYYGVYMLEKETGNVWWAEVVDGEGRIVHDADVMKAGGAWRWLGRVKTVGDLALAAAFIAGIPLYGWLYYRVRRPGEPRGPVVGRRRDGSVRRAGAPDGTRLVKSWQRNGWLITLAAVPVLGWAILRFMPGVSGDRKRRAFMQAGFIWVGFFLFTAWSDETTDLDELSVFTLVMVTLAFVWCIAGGRLLVAPEGFALPENELADLPPPAPPPPRPPKAPGPQEQAGGVPSTAMPGPTANSERLPFDVERPDGLPDFTEVGGMATLKAELRSTIGLMLAFEQEAEAYRITWNGILLHGPPGVGKTFVARAVAGEFGLNLIQVSAGELVSAYRGESSRNVDDCFRFAATKIPCLLFFDEFDAVAQNRQDWPDAEARRTVGQLLQALEEYRSVSELIVMAATNHLEDLDPAVIRPGRFDRHVRVDLPDTEAREAIFAACLKDRPQVADLDLAELARKSAGMTPAAIAQTVELAALEAFRDAAAEGELVHLSERRLEEALTSRGGQDKPLIEDWTWESLILPEDTKAELQELQYVIEDPEMARDLGVEPPTGVLLTGPPGTGKTTIAKVLAAQANCSFYPVSAGDVTSMWLGESERNIQRLFQRARENRPSIIFIDEIDAIASRRGEYGSYDRQINELLQEMDGISGQQGVFVLAATNRPDQLDPALLRGGRLSRTIEIPVPDAAGRLGLLRLFTKKMPLVGVNLDDIVAATDGASGADLKALCQQAGLCALVRARREKVKSPAVTAGDFHEALSDWAASHAAQRRGGA